jgi:hypothetical protein
MMRFQHNMKSISDRRKLIKMSSIHRKTLIMLIVFSITFPILASQTVNASWLSSWQITRNGTIEDINPSVAINPVDRSMVFSYTYYLPTGTPANDIYEIMMSNNTEVVSTDYLGNPYTWGIPEYDDEKQQISNSLGAVKTIYNDYSSVSVSACGEIWVVWQATVNQTGTPETDNEIFVYYQNQTARWIKQVTNDGDDDTQPQVVALNGSYAYVAWISATDELHYVEIVNGIISGVHTMSFLGVIDDIQLCQTGIPNYEKVHLGYHDSDEIFYDNIIRGGDFIILSIQTVASCDNLSMDVAGNNVLFTYQTSDGSIWKCNSSDGGEVFPAETIVVSAGTNTIIDPDCYITDFGAIEIFYSQAADPWDIYSVHNFEGSWVIAPMFGEGSSPNTQNCYNPTIAHYNDTVVGLYNKIINVGSGWDDPNLFAFGYQLMYRTSGSNYNQLELLDEDPAGMYLLEGLFIWYNGSTSDVDLNITYIDTVTLARYSNITTVTSEGGYKSYPFWDPNKYMISNNTYNLSITFANTGTPILRIAIKPWEINTRYNDQVFYNISSDNEVNGMRGIYNFQIAMDFEWSDSGRIQFDSEPNTITNIFDAGNYADFGYLQMTKNERYRFKFTTQQSGHVRAFLFNSSIQTLDPSKALYTWDHNAVKTTSTYMFCNTTGTYFVLVQSESFGTSIQYEFFYGKCPGNITLNSPLNNAYFKWQSVQSVDLKWTPRLSDKDISLYIIQVSNDSTFQTYVQQYTRLKALGTTYTYSSVAEKWLYWRIKAVDDQGNEGFFNTIRRFCFDSVTPNAPIFTLEDQVNDTTIFNIRWQVPTDGAFTVDYYNIYRSTDPDFVPSTGNMISSPGTNTFPSKTDSVSQNDRYYYKVEAVDHVGHVSSMSNMLTVTISYGGTVDATFQDFEVQVGDILEYQVTWIQSSTRNSYNEPLMTYRGVNYGMGSVFHFWIKNIDCQDVLPVRGDFYAKSTESNVPGQYFLGEEDTMIVPFVTNRNETYQAECFELYTQQLLAETAPVTYTSNKYYSTWNDGVTVRDVVCYNYHTNPSSDRSQTSITYVVDKVSGVLAELIFWHEDLQYGYSLKLIDSSAPLSSSKWSYAPFIVPIFIGCVAAIVYAIMKKIQL